jgi:hypothetical protein
MVTFWSQIHLSFFYLNFWALSTLNYGVLDGLQSQNFSFNCIAGSLSMVLGVFNKFYWSPSTSELLSTPTNVDGIQDRVHGSIFN